MKKANFISWNWRKGNSTVACGSSSIKIHNFDYPKRFINRINEVYNFSIKYIYITVCFAAISLVTCIMLAWFL